MWLEGYFGSYPKQLGKLFDKYDQEYTKITKETEFNDYLEDGGVYIVSVWNSSTPLGGIHTVAFTSDEDKNIIVYNRYSNVLMPYKYTSTDEKTGLDLFLEENGDSIVMYEVKK